MSNQKKRELAAYKRFINPERDNEYLIESDRYFLRLLRRNALSQEQQEQIRELRNLCCDAKGYHSSQFLGYRQLCMMQIRRLLTSRILGSSGSMQKILYALVSGMVGLVGMEMNGEGRETSRGILRSQIITLIIHSLFFKIFPQMQRVWYNRI